MSPLQGTKAKSLDTNANGTHCPQTELTTQLLGANLINFFTESQFLCHRNLWFQVEVLHTTVTASIQLTVAHVSLLLNTNTKTLAQLATSLAIAKPAFTLVIVTSFTTSPSSLLKFKLFFFFFLLVVRVLIKTMLIFFCNIMPTSWSHTASSFENISANFLIDVIWIVCSRIQTLL